MDVKISPQWKAWIGDEFEKPYFAELVRFVKQEYATHQVFPAGRNIFHAFDTVSYTHLDVYKRQAC